MGDVSRDEREQHVERRAEAMKEIFLDAGGASANEFWPRMARATMEADRAAGLDPFELKAALERAEADGAAKDLALRAALPYLWTHAGMMPSVPAHDCTMRVAKEVEQALTDHPGGKLLAAEEITTTALPDDNWLVRQLESCRAEVATWPEHKRLAMLAALDGGTG